MNHPSRLLRCLFALSFCALLTVAHAKDRFTGSWDMTLLKSPPFATWGARTGLVQEVYYEGELFHGQPTRVFAYYGRPEGKGPFPAMLLVHGGGGKAFREWAQMWAERGYCALAMDTAGQGPDKKRLPDGGPDQSDISKFRPFTPADVKDMWTYHAVADVVRGHSLLASRPEVDARRIGITGISWGGYLTCIVTGIDDRLKVSVPVYGCGFLWEDSFWLPLFDKLGPEATAQWVSYFDPSRYLAGASCPMLFMVGTTDFAYPLDSYQKSYRLVQAPVDLSIRVGMKHSHQHGWAPMEIATFVDSVLREGEPLPHLSTIKTKGDLAFATFTSPEPVVQGQLNYTTDTGPWQKRTWKQEDAFLKRGRVSAKVPEARPLVYFFTIIDKRGALVSTEHVELP